MAIVQLFRTGIHNVPLTWPNSDKCKKAQMLQIKSTILSFGFLHTSHKTAPRSCRTPWQTRYSVPGRPHRAAGKLLCPVNQHISIDCFRSCSRTVGIFDCSVGFFSVRWVQKCKSALDCDILHMYMCMCIFIDHSFSPSIVFHNQI